MAVAKEQNDKLKIFEGLNLDDPSEVLGAALKAFPGKISLACSFSKEDIVIIDLLKKLDKNPRIFAIDTGRLPDETYLCAESIRHTHGIEIEWFFPKNDAVETLIRDKGLYSFKESVDNRKECCFIRKVEPLNRALNGLEGWITGQRREQSVTRGELNSVEIDEAHGGILKLNPLAAWDYEKTEEYVKNNNLPYNKLYNQGFKSIGCAPCTRAIAEDEHERAGRWWWEDPNNKECGLHIVSK